MASLSMRAAFPRGASRTPPRAHAIDAAEVSAELQARACELANVLLGGRNLALSSATEWRWRRKGSFSLCIAGPHAGRWFDHEAGVGGDGLALIRRQRACSFAQALAWAAAWIGGETRLRTLQSIAAPVSKTQVSRESAALSIWEEAGGPHGTIVETYLARRGIELPTSAGRVLRHHPSAYHSSGSCPAMVALLRDISTDEPCGIHRTFLSSTGERLDKKMLGRAKGAAIKLSADDEVTIGLGIAEGIETALSVMRTGWRPIWALGSSGSIRRFPVLAGIEALTIFADHDENGAGEAAAEACATRWAASAEVTIVTPHRPGQDFNDCLGECA